MGISVTQLLIILAIVLLLFGTKRLRSVGSDLGSAIRSFRTAVKDDASSDKSEKENKTTEKLESDEEIRSAHGTVNSENNKHHS